MAEYGGTILAVQDTAGVNRNTRPKTAGTGYIGDRTPGVNVHSCLTASADGLVLGVLERSMDKTTTLILMYSIIAVMILKTTCAARLAPELPCSLLLGEEE
jgi:hypothetical protein